MASNAQETESRFRTVWTFTALTNQSHPEMPMNTTVARLLGCGDRAEVAGQVPAILEALGLSKALASRRVRILAGSDGTWEPYTLREREDRGSRTTARLRGRFLELEERHARSQAGL